MRKLERFPSAASTSRYPWDQVFDGDVWEVVQGEDFPSKTSTFIANARAQAKRRGGTVRSRTLVEDDRTAVVLQYRAAAVER
jgi:hypothetical protein